MSYTPPNYVDTKAQAILALASVVADTDKTALGDGSVNKALDVLADVLAESDVSVPQTNAGAILALAQYASGMIKPEGTITITENGEGIDVAQYASADVSVSGGGGGDFTTASVEFILDGYTGSPFSLSVPVIDPYDGLISYIRSSDMDDDNPYDVVMYNGELLLGQIVDGARFAASTGSIELRGGGTEAIITGDGTLTISDEE